MKSDPELSVILRALESPDEVDLIQEERQRRIDLRKARIAQEFDTEVDQETADAGGQVAGIRKVLDLADLTFQQGSHFMANKKCQLPENSSRKTSKGTLKAVFFCCRSYTLEVVLSAANAVDRPSCIYSS